MLFEVLCPGTPEGSTDNSSGFKASQNTEWEKPGIEPAIPGLHGIGLSPTPRRLFPSPLEAHYLTVSLDL